MTPVKPEELSGFLDGELPPARAEEVARAIADDPRLQTSLAAIRRLDERCLAMARSTAVAPMPSTPPTVAEPVRAPMLLLGAALLILRAAVRLIDGIAPAAALQAAALALVLGLLLGWAAGDRNRPAIG